MARGSLKRPRISPRAPLRFSAVRTLRPSLRIRSSASAAPSPEAELSRREYASSRPDAQASRSLFSSAGSALNCRWAAIFLGCADSGLCASRSLSLGMLHLRPLL